VLYAVLVAVTGALNLIALIALCAHLVVVLVSRPSGRRRALKAFGLAAAGALAALSPIIVYGAREAGAQLGHLPSASFTSLPSIWEQAGCSSVFSLIVLLALPLLLEHRRRTSAIAVVSAAVLPVLVLWIVSVNSLGFSYFSRYLLFVLPAWAIAVAAAVDRFKGVPPVAFTAVVLATALAVTHDQIVLHGTLSHFEYDYPGPSVSGEDYPAAAAVIEENYEPGDAASFAVAPHLQLGIDYYLPRDEQLRDVFEERTSAQTDSLLPESCASMARCVAKPPARVWLVESGDVLAFSTEQVDRAFTLDYLYRRVRIWQVSGITLTLLERIAPR
jgi:mannosyltransferase